VTTCSCSTFSCFLDGGGGDASHGIWTQGLVLARQVPSTFLITCLSYYLLLLSGFFCTVKKYDFNSYHQYFWYTSLTNNTFSFLPWNISLFLLNYHFLMSQYTKTFEASCQFQNFLGCVLPWGCYTLSDAELLTVGSSPSCALLFSTLHPSVPHNGNIHPSH
jgi:hypothetical protein